MRTSKVLFSPDGANDDDGASERSGVDVVDVEPENKKYNNFNLLSSVEMVSFGFITHHFNVSGIWQA